VAWRATAIRRCLASAGCSPRSTRPDLGAPAQPGQLGCALRFVPDIRALLLDDKTLGPAPASVLPAK